jgi:DNA-binding SARP family transcriptional activator
MQYQVLGPLRIIDGDSVVSISAPKMETILATLLLRANEIVSMEQLTFEIWGDNRPRRAVPAIHVYISQLRKLLSGGTGQQGSPIRTRSPGYLLAVRPEDLDWLQFQQLLDQGRTELAGERYTTAYTTLGSALRLWRGSALGELCNGPIVSGFVSWLEELRLECVESHVEAGLRMGRHRELVSHLYRLIVEHPLHEVFYGQLMRALSASDRRADALGVYRKAWEVLDRELGLEPGSRLQELQRALLTDRDRLYDRTAV